MPLAVAPNPEHTHLWPATAVALGDGTMVDLADPDPAAISIPGLIGNICALNRFGGSTDWTVGQHSLLCADIAAKGWPNAAEIELAALIHDFHEGAFGDLTRPAQVVIEAEYGGAGPIGTIRRRLDAAIYDALGFRLWQRDDIADRVAQIDRTAFAIEWRQFMSPDLAATGWTGDRPVWKALRILPKPAVAELCIERLKKLLVANGCNGPAAQALLD